MANYKVEPNCANYAILVAGDEDFAEVVSVLNDRNVVTKVVAFDRVGSRVSKALTNEAKKFTLLDGTALSENQLIIP